MPNGSIRNVAQECFITGLTFKNKTGSFGFARTKRVRFAAAPHVRSAAGKILIG